MSTMTTRMMPLMLGAMLAMGAGCDASITGEQGNLEFRYMTDDGVSDFNKAIAVGAKLDLRVYKAGTGASRDVTIKEAVSESSDTLAVSNTSGNAFTVEGVAAGTARLSVKATDQSGVTLDDSVTMRAAVPEVLKLKHLCGGDDQARRLYMAGKPAYVMFDMELSDGQPVVGYGYYPVKATPEAAFTVKTDSRDQQFLQVTMGAEAGEAEITSTIDAAKLPLTIVTEGQIDGAKLDSADAVGVGKTALLTFSPTVGGEGVCQAQITYEVTSSTPEICTVKAITSEDVDEEVQALLRKYSWFEVSGVAVGDCKLSLTMPNAAAGAGHTAELSVSVQNLGE